MNLGRFSLSLSVKDIAASRAFYEKLGFEVTDGQFKHQETFEMEAGQDWLILTQGDTVIGLFQGMFENNVLTFHPTDVREVQRALKEQGIELISEADESTTGPASAMLTDPDGNVLLLDQD